MTTKSQLLARAGLVACAFGAASPAFAVEQTMPADAGVAAQATETGATAVDAEIGIADIVVTAQRREESLQRVPVAVTALDATALRAQSIVQLSDIARVAPNVAISSSGNTAPTNALPVIYIRGIGQQDPAIYSDPGVPVYVDGVYVARSAGGAIDLPDIGRVEVLRGPQGTLFGKNAVGGAINVVTLTPGRNPGTNIDLTGGTYRLYQLRAVTNIAVNGQLGVTAALDAKHKNGFGDRLEFGTGRKLGRLGDQRHLSFRARARWAPTDRLTVDLSGDYTGYRDTATPGQGQLVPSGLLNLQNAIVPGSPVTPARVASGRYDNFSLNPARVRDRLGGGSTTIAYDLGGATIKSISAYRKAHDIFSRDADGAPAVYLEAFRDQRSAQFTQELQILGKAWDDRVDYIVGAFYLHDRSRAFDRALVTPQLFGARGGVFGAPTASQPPLALAQDRARDYADRQTTNSYAGYGQVTARLTDALGVTAGIRYTSERKRAVISSVSPASGIVYVAPTLREKTFKAWTPRFAINYQFSDRVLGYVSASRGFKSGGFNGRPSNLPSLTTFAPERVWSYEAGLKSEFLDRRLRVNLAAYRADYDDIQLSRQIIIGGVLVSDILNVDKTRILGGEAEVTLIPVPGLELGVAAGYTHSEYTRIAPGQGAVTPSGKIPYTPKVTANFSARYRIDLGSAGSLTPGVNYAYRSSTYTTPINSSFSFLPSFSLLSGRIAYAPEGGKWDVSLFGTNLTNKRYRISIGDSNGIGLLYNLFGPPRELGATVGVHF